ncbi:hypothetical protein QFZ87_000744 [Bacillus sp. SLBN-46]|uniref:CBO0543 family protein n=1 Tax=Bacillus sp. SLBN-46 TaxID=3042283 RepID=UPI002862C222|nr:CBO0543 family protein [Bacillus sp. SLBN-46]MDR6121147.1 hypothetical protein [Bacillus sp. SLBN-46]
MSRDYTVIILIWVIGIIAYLFLTPKNRYRKVLFALILCQAFVWVSSLLHVKYHLLAFPVREFPKATDVLVTTEYFFYPLLSGFYIISEPKRSPIIRFLYLSLWISGLTVMDVMLEKYTNLIEYVHYAWYLTWLNFFWIFVVTHLIYHWFFKDKAHFHVDREAVK